jgi:hypothetical protein
MSIGVGSLAIRDRGLVGQRSCTGRAEGELSVSLPARQYDLAARLVAAAVNDATRFGTARAPALVPAIDAEGSDEGQTPSDPGEPRCRRKPDGQENRTDDEEPDDDGRVGDCGALPLQASHEVRVIVGEPMLHVADGLRKPSFWRLGFESGLACVASAAGHLLAPFGSGSCASRNLVDTCSNLVDISTIPGESTSTTGSGATAIRSA